MVIFVYSFIMRRSALAIQLFVQNATKMELHAQR